MKSSEIPLVPLSADRFAELRSRTDVVSKSGAVPRLGSTYDNPKQTTAFAGFCERFDLSTEEGRSSYAELSAKLLPGTEVLRLWEERVHGPSGEIYIYVSYVKVLDVFQSGTENFEL